MLVEKVEFLNEIILVFSPLTKIWRRGSEMKTQSLRVPEAKLLKTLKTLLQRSMTPALGFVRSQRSSEEALR